MAFVLLSRSRSKPQGSVKPAPKRKSVRGQHSADSRFGFAKPVVQPPTAALPTAPVIQTKLKMGEPNDEFEQEADRVANQVMRMPDNISPPAVQRMCNECSEEDEDMLQAQTKQDRGIAPGLTPDAESQVRALKEGGQPLPKSLRVFFEPRFGHDFSKVRVHPYAGAAAEAVHARAFTLGHDIVFDPGQYAPNTKGGKWLLAHELTHVVQQKHASLHDGLIQRKGESPKTPTYRDCTASTTLGSATANKELESARDRARDYVDVAISKLTQDPARDKKEGSYRIALGRHFISPSATDRQEIRANYMKIRDQLKPEKIRCVAEQKDREVCEKQTNEPAAFMRGGESFLCDTFWTMNHKCRAMVLIHEAAHAIGIGLGSPHPPYRGNAGYPFGAEPPSADQSTSLRMDNPDAYSFFAAHIWREVDTECFVSEIIRMTGEKPA